MNGRIGTIVTEAKSIVKPLIAVAALIGGGLVPFFQLINKYISSIELLLILLGIFAIYFLASLCWRLAANRDEMFWFDRKYNYLKTEWKYALNEDGETLDGECTSERELECLDGEIAHLNVSITKDESFVPFDPHQNYHQELITFSRGNGGTVSLRPPHKSEGASFAFRFTFDPPLVKGETARLKYKYKIPRFKIGTLEHLRAKMTTAKTTTRDYEYNSIKTAYPISQLRYSIIFPKECSITPLGIEVRRGTANFPLEERNIIDKRMFRVESDSLGCRMILERQNPPMKAGYRLKWRPPTRDMLSSSI